MTRIIERDREKRNSFTEIARIQDVSEEELFKKYTEEITEKGIVQKTDEEIRLEEEQLATLEMIANLGIEGLDIDMNNNPLQQLTDMCAEGFKEELTKKANDPEYQAMIKEMNEKQGVYTIDMNENWTNEDDPLLIKQFAQEQEKILAQMKARSERKKISKETTMKEVNEAFYMQEEIANSFDATAGNSAYRSGNTNNIFGESKSKPTNGYRSTSAKSETTGYSNDQTDYDYQAAQKQREDYLGLINGKMMDMAANGEKKQQQPKKKKLYGKRKLSLVSMWNSAKEWTKTKEAAIFKNIGAMLALQTGMALVTKRLSFEGPTQAIGYMAMGMGSFYFAREIRALGFDARRMAF